MPYAYIMATLPQQTTKVIANLPYLAANHPKETSSYRMIMIDLTRSKQLLWEFLRWDHIVFWVILIEFNRPFCEIKSGF